MPEQDPSRLEAFKARLDSTADLVKTKAAIGLIGVVGITGSSVAVAEQISAEPAFASDAPNVEATASNLQEDCGREGTAKPGVIKAEITAPHMNHGETLRSYHIKTGNPELSESCDRYTRLSLYDIFIGKKNMGLRSSLWGGNRKGIGGADGILVNNRTGDYSPYDCKKGPQKRQVTLAITQKVIDSQKHRLVKARQYKEPFKVRSAC